MNNYTLLHAQLPVKLSARLNLKANPSENMIKYYCNIICVRIRRRQRFIINTKQPLIKNFNFFPQYFFVPNICIIYPLYIYRYICLNSYAVKPEKGFIWWGRKKWQPMLSYGKICLSFCLLKFGNLL